METDFLLCTRTTFSKFITKQRALFEKLWRFVSNELNQLMTENMGLSLRKILYYNNTIFYTHYL